MLLNPLGVKTSIRLAGVYNFIYWSALSLGALSVCFLTVSCWNTNLVITALWIPRSIASYSPYSKRSEHLLFVLRAPLALTLGEHLGQKGQRIFFVLVQYIGVLIKREGNCILTVVYNEWMNFIFIIVTWAIRLTHNVTLHVHIKNSEHPAQPGV